MNGERERGEKEEESTHCDTREKKRKRVASRAAENKNKRVRKESSLFFHPFLLSHPLPKEKEEKEELKKTNEANQVAEVGSARVGPQKVPRDARALEAFQVSKTVASPP